MGIEIAFSIIFVVLGTMTVFSRQPFFSLFSLMGLIFSMSMLYLIKGSLLGSSILLLSVGTVAVVIVIQLFMNLDLEKEFQQYYKMNLVPMFGMMVMGIILGVLALSLFGDKEIFSELSSKKQFENKIDLMFVDYGQMILITIIGLIGVITSTSLLVKENEDGEINEVHD